MKPILMWLAAPALAVILAGCEVRQTEEGELPEVDVRGGKMPEYDVDPADVKIREKKVEMTVPDVDVVPRREEPATTQPKTEPGRGMMSTPTPNR